MTCSEFKELVWAYVLDALEPAERAAFEEHLRSTDVHQGCKEALDRAYQVTPRLASMLPSARPDPRVWREIEAQIQEGTAASSPKHSPSPSSFVPWAIAAAALLVCGVAVGGALAVRRALEHTREQLALTAQKAQELKRCEQELASLRDQAENQRAALALLELPSTKLVPLNPPQGSTGASRGSALLNQEQQKAIVLVSALQPQVGKDYELWIIRGDAKIAAGLLHPGADGRTMARVDPKLLAGPQPDAFAVTLEPEGGGETPRGPIVLVGAPAKG